MDIKRINDAGIPAKSALLAFAELLEMTGLHPSLLGELIELGWLSPVKTMEEVMLFRSRDVYRLRKLHRISRDFELPLVGASIIVDLLERIEYLENKVNELNRLL